MSVVATWWSV